MAEYRPPVADLRFALEHVVGYPEVSGLPGFEHADLDTIAELLESYGEFVAKVVAPTNRVGDAEGVQYHSDGSVTMPQAFKDAYRRYVETGWGTISMPQRFGGEGFPRAVGLAMQEMITSANMAFALGPLLTQGAIEALTAAGTEELQQRFVPKMVTGEWAGTMNLTEPQAGSDVGALTTRAVRREDGSYAITGQKIFISFGEHDLTDQIVHLVLARILDAPEGTAGISCFVVPKFLVNEDGSLGERNGLRALAVEHKMGIHGSPTCVMSYEGATGYLLGEENRGMAIMFVMMNTARTSVGLEGVAVAERAYQDASAYARQRIQGRAPGASAPSPIIDFPDVRRMLLTQQASIAALRRLILLQGAQVDVSTHHPDAAVRERANEVVALLTPICKAFGSDQGNELTSLALQVHGGSGYIEETGVAQHYRDVRIAAIYEGTNGIQAADLVGRKLGVRGGASVLEFISQLAELDSDLAAAGEDFADIRSPLHTHLETLKRTTEWMLRTGAADPRAALAGSSPYLRIWGLCLCAWLLAKSALAAASIGDDSAAEQLVLARFYAQQILPQVSGLEGAATAGARDLYALEAVPAL